MKVNVLWVSHHEDILARGYYDQALLEAVFAHDIWTPPFPVTFTHHEVRHDDWGKDFVGGIVILPARHHVDDVDWFVNELDELAWSIVILAGDEEWSFPWARITETPTRKVWIMQPRPEHAHLMGIPGGWYPGTRPGISVNDEHTPRPLDWLFAGQVRDNLRRKELVKELRTMPNGYLLETDGYLQGMPIDDYYAMLPTAKVIPCPSGPMTVDTARPLEAMEAGCVPIVDTLTPRGEDYDYWSIVFGDGCPLRRVRSWKEFRGQLKDVLSTWPVESNRVFSWWQQWKRSLVHRLYADLEHVMGGTDTTNECPDDLITVIITTSPAPIHPSTSHIITVIDSIRAQLPRAEIIVVCDGVRAEDAHMTDSYNEYIRQLLWHCNFNHYWGNVVPIVMEEWGHQANATRRALELVKTPLLLFVEHDTPIIGDINWPNLCDFLLSERVTTIQLHFNESIHPDHENLRVGQDMLHGHEHFTPWAAYWQRPHLTRTQSYRSMLAEHFPESSRTMIEDRMHGIVYCDFADNGDAAWDNWRIVVYAPKGNMIRSGHLDSRRGAAKYEMVYE